MHSAYQFLCWFSKLLNTCQHLSTYPCQLSNACERLSVPINSSMICELFSYRFICQLTSPLSTIDFVCLCALCLVDCMFHAALLVFAHSLGSCECEAMAPKMKSKDPANVCCSVMGELGDLFEETSPPMKRQRQSQKPKCTSTRAPRREQCLQNQIHEDDDAIFHFADDAFSHLMSLPPMGPTSYRQH